MAWPASNRKYSYEDSKPPEYSTVVGNDGSTNLIKVGISCSDSALNHEIDYSPKKPPRMPNAHGNSADDYRILPRTQPPHSGVKSAELRRKSEALCSFSKAAELSHNQDEMRRKSEINFRHKDSTSVFNHGSFNENRKNTNPVMHQRSVVHVSGGSKSKQNIRYNTLPGGNRRAVTSQPLQGTLSRPYENPDWPVLNESECESNGDYSVIHKANTGNGVYGIPSVTEGVKGFMKILYIPFQCCKRKVCSWCCLML